MKGLVIEEFEKPYSFRTDLPTPELEPGLMLVKVKVAGFCHTELLVLDGEYHSQLPMIPGHENVGVIAAIGEAVTGFNVGDRVGVGLFRKACGQCRECANGTSNFCSSVELAGLNVDGGMAEYVLADPAWTVHLPDEMPFVKAAPLMCAGSTVYNSIKRANLAKGGIIGIIGLGGLGHLAVQFAKLLGYQCVGVDTRRAPRDLVASLPSTFSADLLIDPSEGTEAALSTISASLDGATGLGAAIVCTDAIEAYRFATSILAKHGILVAVGQPKGEIPFHWSTFVSQDITIVPGGLGSNAMTQQMINIVQEKELHVEVKEFPFGTDTFERLMNEYRSEGMSGKVVIRIEDE
ncbi:hypothetical protein FRC14_007831 [Serendipita sp. 396]|nr:hypothetical protein FRC14_007831 [Serendipita sp. 396]